MSDTEWLKQTIAPKTDQINADDLEEGPRTVTVVRVKQGKDPDQPVEIELKECKMFRPCKSMRRVITGLWGFDATAWVGRKMTLYRDSGVTFGRERVGGIRISHMSDIPQSGADIKIIATRGQKKPYHVECLKTDQRAADIKLVIESIRKHYAEQKYRAEMYAAWNVTDPRKPEQWTDETLAAAVEFAKSLEGN